MTSRIVLAYADTAEAEARALASRLDRLGYRVDRLRGRPKAADKVVMLWSRAAWGTPALRAAARRAHAAGKLVCIRLDSAPPPVSGARVSPLPGGRADRTTWRRLLNPKPRTAATAPVTRKRERVEAQPRARRNVAAVSVGTPKHRELGDMKEKNSRGFAIALTLTLLAIGATAFAYNREPAVAERIDGAAARVYAEASKVAALAP